MRCPQQIRLRLIACFFGGVLLVLGPAHRQIPPDPTEIGCDPNRIRIVGHRRFPDNPTGTKIGLGRDSSLSGTPRLASDSGVRTCGAVRILVP